jgi:hypothetical protein
LIFSTTFVWNISHSKKNSARYYHGCKQVFKHSTRYSYQISMKPAFTLISSTNFSKILIYQISWKSVQRKRRCCVRTGRQAIGQTRRNSRFSQLPTTRYYQLHPETQRISTKYTLIWIHLAYILLKTLHGLFLSIVSKYF